MKGPDRVSYSNSDINQVRGNCRNMASVVNPKVGLGFCISQETTASEACDDCINLSHVMDDLIKTMIECKYCTDDEATIYI